jgi:hypothetical protein
MKLTKEQKEKLIGKKIEIDHVLKPEYTYTECKGFREIKKEKLEQIHIVLVVGFTHLCEGEAEFIDYESGNGFTIKKKIPVIKVASGIFGKIHYTSYDLIRGVV